MLWWSGVEAVAIGLCAWFVYEDGGSGAAAWMALACTSAISLGWRWGEANERANARWLAKLLAPLKAESELSEPKEGQR